jgi:hypothetical protein
LQNLTRCPEGKNFSMGCRVFVALPAILSCCDQVTVCVNDNGTDWHFTRLTRRLSECDRLSHPLSMN